MNSTQTNCDLCKPSTLSEGRNCVNPIHLPPPTLFAEEHIIPSTFTDEEPLAIYDMDSGEISYLYRQSTGSAAASDQNNNPTTSIFNFDDVIPTEHPDITNVTSYIEITTNENDIPYHFKLLHSTRKTTNFSRKLIPKTRFRHLRL